MAYPPGRYKCVVDGVSAGVSDQKGTPYVGLIVRPEDGEYQREVKMWITANTYQRVCQRLRDLGWSGVDFGELGASSFRGKTVELVCKNEEVNGNTYDRFDFPAPGDNLNAGVMTVELAQKLNKLCHKELKNADTPDDDIPF